jgi:hypothetical protein
VIPEAQLKTWTALGSVTQSRDTYATIKRALEDSNSPYCRHGFDTFLQGSYGNDTNVYGDSDVDIVIRQTSLYYYDINGLNDADKAAFRRDHTSAAQYTLHNFRRDVASWLSQQYPQDFDPSGTKAVYIRQRNNRRNADVLVCARHKRFISYQSAQNQRFVDGVIFFPTNGGEIINYPKQHSDNMTAQHQATNSWFKPAVRIVKNMRNKMITDGMLRDGVAPSYYLEGLLYNAPPNMFNTDWQTAIAGCLSWAVQTDKTQLLSASRMHWLVRDKQETSWPTADCEAFLNAAVDLWSNWGRPRLKWI